MKGKTGWVTVLMPAYNRADFLPRSVKSCLEQLYLDVEIVVDDGSQDGTAEILKELQSRYGEERLRVIRNERNLGACRALNRALQEIRGEFFQFLDSDDFLHPEKIKSQVEALRRSGADAAVCGFRYVDAKTLREIRCDENRENVKQRLAKFRGINNASTLMRTGSLDESLTFNPVFSFYIDRDFFFRYFLTLKKWIYTPGIWVDYLQHEESITHLRKGQKVPFEESWRSAKEFARREAAQIPEDNAWMLPELARNLSAAAYHAGAHAEAQRLALEALLISSDLKQKARAFFHFLRAWKKCLMKTSFSKAEA